MTLSRNELELIAAWAEKARPETGVYFRSVSYNFMDPDTVLNGAGAALHGGRFASIGTPAVYLSESDAVASQEVTGRKNRLGGATLINVAKYPRIIFAVHFSLHRVLDLSTRPLPRGLGQIRDRCLGDDLGPSQALGDALVSLEVEALRFPSQAGPGKNMIVYRQCCAPDSLTIHNEMALRTKLHEITRSIKK